MRTSTLAAGLLAGLAAAQRPSNTSICDYYTTALLTNNTAANQATILTLLVNTVVIGNYTKPTIPGVTFPDVLVPGILDPNATMNGTAVNLVPYFDGGLASSNRGGSSGVAVNFLDGGGAAPLMQNKPADNTSSNQYTLLTHLYQFFGVLLGCTMQGSTAFPAYGGQASMYHVHKYMALDAAQVGYFISQVGLAAKSFGVATADIDTVAGALEMYFDVRCAAPVTLAPALGSQLQSICIDSDCTQATNASCSSYAAVVQPGVANSTLAMGEGNASSTATMSGPSSTSSSSAAPSVSEGAAPVLSAGAFAAGGLAIFAFFL